MYPSTVSGQASFYTVGTTACGKNYTNHDYVAGIARNFFTNPDPKLDTMCGKKVQVYDPDSGLSVEATIADICRECLYGDINLSRSAFEQLRSTRVGTFSVEWQLLNSD